MSLIVPFLIVTVYLIFLLVKKSHASGMKFMLLGLSIILLFIGLIISFVGFANEYITIS